MSSPSDSLFEMIPGEAATYDREAAAASTVRAGDFMVVVGDLGRRVLQLLRTEGIPVAVWFRGHVYSLDGRSSPSEALTPDSPGCVAPMTATSLAAHALNGRVNSHFVTARVNVYGQVQASSTDGFWTGGLAVADVLALVTRPVIAVETLDEERWLHATFDLNHRAVFKPDGMPYTAPYVVSPHAMYRLRVHETPSWSSV